jgi:hypothetical protein
MFLKEGMDNIVMAETLGRSKKAADKARAYRETSLPHYKDLAYKEMVPHMVAFAEAKKKVNELVETRRKLLEKLKAGELPREKLKQEMAKVLEETKKVGESTYSAFKEERENIKEFYADSIKEAIAKGLDVEHKKVLNGLGINTAKMTPENVEGLYKSLNEIIWKKEIFKKDNASRYYLDDVERTRDAPHDLVRELTPKEAGEYVAGLAKSLEKVTDKALQEKIQNEIRYYTEMESKDPQRYKLLKRLEDLSTTIERLQKEDREVYARIEKVCDEKGANNPAAQLLFHERGRVMSETTRNKMALEGLIKELISTFG